MQNVRREISPSFEKSNFGMNRPFFHTSGWKYYSTDTPRASQRSLPEPDSFQQIPFHQIPGPN